MRARTLSELEEHQPLSLQNLGGSQLFANLGLGVLPGLGETRGELEDGLRRTREGIAFLTIEDVVVLPVLADGEALMETAVLVRLGEEPRGVHEVFA